MNFEKWQTPSLQCQHMNQPSHKYSCICKKENMTHLKGDTWGRLNYFTPPPNNWKGQGWKRKCAKSQSVMRHISHEQNYFMERTILQATIELTRGNHTFLGKATQTYWMTQPKICQNMGDGVDQCHYNKVSDM